MNKFMIKIITILLYSTLTTSAYVTANNVDAGDVNQGRDKAVLCAGCHGSNGISLTNEVPNLAGQKSNYLVKQLKAFKTKSRIEPSMNAMTSHLSDQDIANVASYFAQLNSHPMTVAVNTSDDIIKIDASHIEFPETVYASMKDSASIISFPNQKIVTGGPNMLYTALTPDGKTLLSTSPSTASVYVFDTKTLAQRAIIKVGKAPKGVKVTPDGKFAYVSNQGSNDISIIDLAQLKNTAKINVPAGPHNVRFTKKGDIAYVTLQGGAGLGVVDTKLRKVIKVIPIAGITGPHNLDLSMDEKTAYVRDFVHHVAVVNLSSEHVEKIITVGSGHGGIDVAPNGEFVATAAIGDSIVSIINPKTLTVNNIEVGKGPHGIRASKDSQWLYVTLTGENKIAVINTKTMTLDKKINVEKFPFWLAVKGNP
jgi:YVTN family beta-propeller protein